MFKPNADGCVALLHRVRDEQRGWCTMNYETSSGEFVQCFWIAVLKGFKRGPIGACDTVVDHRDVIAWLDVRCDCRTAEGENYKAGSENAHTLIIDR